MIEDLKKQLADFMVQRDKIQNSYQQVTGAIFACESLIKQMEEKNKETENEEI
jgi:hypothetical protein